MSVCVALEVGDSHVSRGSSSGGLDIQPSLDRITTLACKNVSLKHELVEKDKRIERLEAKLRAVQACAASTTAAASRRVAAASAFSTELELLHTRVTSGEKAAVEIGQQHATYRERLSTYSAQASHMFSSMHETDYSMERVRLRLLVVHGMYGESFLQVGDNPRPEREFPCATIGFFCQVRSQLVDRAEHVTLVDLSSFRKVVWAAYAIAADSRMGDAARVVGLSSEVWLDEQCRFCELTTSVRALGETIERQARSLANVLGALEVLVRLRCACGLVRAAFPPIRRTR